LSRLRGGLGRRCNRRMGSPLLIAAIAAGATLAGVTLQWVFSQVSAYLVTRRENGARLNAVLAELLGIRHLLLVQPKTADPTGFTAKLLTPEQRQQAGPIPPEVRALVAQWVTPILPDPRATLDRYAAAVTALAALDPSLSYQLRYEGLALDLMRMIGEAGAATGAPPEQLTDLQQIIADELVPDLEAAILAVATSAGGWWRRRQVRALMKRAPVSEKEMREGLQRILARVLKATGSGVVLAGLSCIWSEPARAQRTWQLHSRVDEMTDRRATWADLDASAEITSTWGTFRPTLELACFGQDSTIRLRLYTGVAANIDGADPNQAYAQIRFDTAPAMSGVWDVQHIGATSMVDLRSLTAPGQDSASILGSGRFHERTVRDATIGRLLRARRVLVRYRLLSGEEVVAVFQPAAGGMRRALATVYAACGAALPGTGP